MKKMKRIVAVIAMLAVLLSSFAFAEGTEAVEGALSVEAAVVEAVVPAEEEAAAEEIDAELLAEEVPAVEAAAVPAVECTDHFVVCSMPGICIICQTPVQGVEPQHIGNLYEKTPVVLPDDPSLHGYLCDLCGDYVDPEEHFTSCQMSDTSVCGVCGAPISADLVWHKDIVEQYTPIAGTNTHGRYCPSCKEYVYVSTHYVDCTNADLAHCEDCGIAVGEDAIHHDGKYDTGASATCTKCGATRGVDQLIVPEELVLGVDETYTVNAKVLPDVAAVLKYVSSDTDCVEVSKNGVITAVKKGSATVTVTATGEDGKAVSAGIDVTVKAAPTSVSLSPSKGKLFIGQTGELKATLKGSSSAAQLYWESSDPTVATVDADGVVTAHSVGKATITVYTYKSKVKDTCEITVSAEPVAIEVDSDDLYMYYKQTLNLNARLVDEDGNECEGELTYESSHPSNVAVSDSGKITIKKSTKGTGIITISSSNGLTLDVYVTVCAVPSKVSLEETEIELERGEEYQIEPIIGDDEATVFSYSSKDKDVASVDKNGLLTAEGEGSTTITVKTHNSKKATLKVKVVDPYAPTSIELSEEGTYYLPIGEELALDYILYPETAESELEWTTSKKKVATVDEDGVVTALKEGSAKITVETYNGKKDTLTIEVVDPDVVSAVVLDESGTVYVGIGETISLNANVLPETAETTLSWSSKSSKIATVDEDGVVEGIKTGSTTITVKSKNGKKDTVTVKVVDPDVADSVVLSESGTVTLNVGEPLQLEAVVYPETADYELTWSTSAKKYATVDEDGFVTPVAKGTATITVKTDNGKKDTVKIKVVDEYKPTSIKLPGVTGLIVGKQEILVPEIQPADAKTYLTWTSSNNRILTVDDGVITAVGPGSATITVETHNGKEASVRITVGEALKPSAVTASIAGNGHIGIGESAQISAVVTPADAVYTLSYASSNAAVVKVDDHGIVTGVAEGTATITVSTDNGLKAYVTVTVDPEKDPSAGTELSSAINGSLISLGNLLGGLKEVDGGYSDASGAVEINMGAGSDKVKRIELTGASGCSLYGVKIGMSFTEAVTALQSNGVKIHYGGGGAILAEKTNVSTIEVYTDDADKVIYIGAFAG